MDKRFGIHGLASALLVLLLVGCGYSSVPQAPGSSQAVTVRVILTFGSHPPAADDRQLMSHLAETCRCVPVFVRPYLDHALIYQVALPHGLSFASFERALLAKGAVLGIQGVEQDGLEHPYVPR